jgi:hypothetical protein
LTENSTGNAGAQQKVVSIFLAGQGDRKEGVQEHLNDYLSLGWRVKQLETLNALGVGATRPAGSNRESWGGWIIVLLEKA